MGILFDNAVGKAASILALSMGLCTGIGTAQAEAPAMHVDHHVQPLNSPREFLAARSLAVSAEIQPLQVQLDASKEYHAASAPLDGAMQVGAQRLSAQTATVDALASKLQWRSTVSGSLIAAISMHSEGAYGIRMGVEIEQLPGSALLRVYTQDDRAAAYEIAGQRVLQILQANLDAGDGSAEGRTWWTPDTGGDEVTLEVELPPGTSVDTLRIAIPRVMHVYENLSLPLESEMQFSSQLNESLSCNLDSTCYEDFSVQRNAVARMLYIQDGLGYVCTGTLLADTARSGTPYFVTANHCINSQTVASTLETSWFYRTPTCNSRTLSSANRVLRNGATLLYATATYDATLLRLNDAPPAGAVFAGWTNQTVAAGTSAVGIHHPRGDLQKISFGTVYSSVSCEPSSSGSMLCTADSGSSSSSGNFNLVIWSQGLTQPGSSGSGLFVQGRLAGMLYGGDGASCSASGSSSIYGRFDRLFPAIQKWLAASPGAIARSPVYRFYNAETGAHFYTGSVAERDFVIAQLPKFQYENVAFYASAQPQQALSPVFRFYNQDSGAHFYTINEGERDQVRSNLPRFDYEGPTWYGQQNAVAGSTPVYRFYNQDSGAHFYTANASERDYVINTLTRFRYEGVAYYVWNSQ